MKKTFQKSLIAASVGAVLAASSLVANAADNVLFPFVTSKAGAYTFVSLANSGAALSANPYHFYYMTKPVGSANSVGCNHFDALGKTTTNDLMQFEVSKKVDMKTVFGDTTSTAIHLPLAGHEGFLIVASDTATAQLYHGEATIIDAASGLYYSYSTSNLTTVSAVDPDFGNAAITDAAVDKFASWYPASAVNTTYFVLPTAVRSVMAAVAGGGAIATLQANTAGIVGGGAYDINETPFSGTQNPKVTCFGYVKPADFLQPGTAAATANGGWMNSNFVNAAGDTANGFLQFKVQDSTALGAKFTTIARDTAN